MCTIQVRSGNGGLRRSSAYRRVHLATVLLRPPPGHRPGRRQARLFSFRSSQVWGYTPKQRVAAFTLRRYSFGLRLAIAQADARPVFQRLLKNRRDSIVLSPPPKKVGELPPSPTDCRPNSVDGESRCGCVRSVITATYAHNPGRKRGAQKTEMQLDRMRRDGINVLRTGGRPPICPTNPVMRPYCIRGWIEKLEGGVGESRRQCQKHHF